MHRIGRTARAGASGKAITLACESYVMALEAIEGLIGFRLPSVHVEDDMLVKPVPPTHRARAPGAARRSGGAAGRGHGRGARAAPRPRGGAAAAARGRRRRQAAPAAARPGRERGSRRCSARSNAS